jgi:hypothetical protein
MDIFVVIEKNMLSKRNLVWLSRINIRKLFVLKFSESFTISKYQGPQHWLVPYPILYIYTGVDIFFSGTKCNKLTSLSNGSLSPKARLWALWSDDGPTDTSFNS